MRLLSLSRSCIPAGADGPNRLIREHGFLEFFRAQAGQTAAQLGGKHLFHFTAIALVQRFTDTNNRTKGGFMRGPNLAIHDFVSLTEQGASLAVTEHDVTH